jgi:hypothetical protein
MNLPHNLTFYYYPPIYDQSPNSFFHSGLPIKTVYAVLIRPIHAACPVHLNLHLVVGGD